MKNNNTKTNCTIVGNGGLRALAGAAKARTATAALLAVFFGTAEDQTANVVTLTAGTKVVTVALAETAHLCAMSTARHIDNVGVVAGALAVHDNRECHRAKAGGGESNV